MTQSSSERDTEHLLRDIEETRERFAEEVSALGDRLSADNLKYTVKKKAKEAIVEARDRAVETAANAATTAGVKARSAGITAMETIRDNPVPTAMVGFGIGWLVFEGIRERRRFHGMERRGDRAMTEPYEPVGYGSYVERPEGYLSPEPREHAARDGDDRSRIRNVTSGLRDKTSNAYHRTGERVAHTGEVVRDRVNRASEIVVRRTRQGIDVSRQRAHQLADAGRAQYEARPIVVGILAVAAGIGLGALIPASRKEQELIAPYAERTRERIREERDRLREVAKDSTKAGAEAARDTAARELSTGR